MTYQQPDDQQRPAFTPHPQQDPRYGQPAYQPPPPYAQQPYGQYPPQTPQQQYAPQTPPRRRRRVFLWVFLGIQALFIVLIIAGIASKPAGTPVAQQVAQQCGNGGWQGLFKSYGDCTKHYAVALNDATNAGKGIGVALIVILWVGVDVILGISYGIYRLARR